MIAFKCHIFRINTIHQIQLFLSIGTKMLRCPSSFFPQQRLHLFVCLFLGVVDGVWHKQLGSSAQNLSEKFDIHCYYCEQKMNNCTKQINQAIQIQPVKHINKSFANDSVIAVSFITEVKCAKGHFYIQKAIYHLHETDNFTSLKATDILQRTVTLS